MNLEADNQTKHLSNQSANYTHQKKKKKEEVLSFCGLILQTGIFIIRKGHVTTCLTLERSCLAVFKSVRNNLPYYHCYYAIDDTLGYNANV